VAEVDTVAQGRVWTGLAARELGLVDTVGGLTLAMDLAREAANLDPGGPVEMLPHVERPWYQRLFESALEEDAEVGAEAADPTGLTRSPVLRAWLAASRLHDGRVLALMPWSIHVR
jgi:ClpP class serine protease